MSTTTMTNGTRSTPSIHYYYSPGVSSLAPHVLLHSIGLPFESIPINVIAGVPESFRKINPKMKVPVLVLNNQAITEVPAIMTAISQLKPEAKIFGKTSFEHAKVYEWLCYLSGTLHDQGYGMLQRPNRFSDDTVAHASIRAKGRQIIAAAYEYIEENIAQGAKHMVGDDFTAVDAFVLVFWRWGVDDGFKIEQKCPKLAGVIAELLRRDAVWKTVEREGIEVKIPEM